MIIESMIVYSQLYEEAESFFPCPLSKMTNLPGPLWKKGPVPSPLATVPPLLDDATGTACLTDPDNTAISLWVDPGFLHFGPG